MDITFYVMKRRGFIWVCVCLDLDLDVCLDLDLDDQNDLIS